jgi:UDP:flavonoid glycosyltransferase YjiC (YdhE family)
MNLGHLARLLPIATRLQVRGHSVLVAVREIPAAASVLGPVGIPFVQAPHLPQGIPLPERASGYADILLSQGWSDPQVLWGLTQNWHNLMRMFRPNAVVIDYSPTAQLATRIAAIPAVLIGNGFELPPATDPLPPFPGFSWATTERAVASERIAVTNANAVLRRFQRPSLRSLSELFNGSTSVYVTFPELDHYGARPNERYVGPLLDALQTEKVDWPHGSKRVFACLRPDTANGDAILGALQSSGAAVVCFAPGFTRQKLQHFASSQIRFAFRPVDLKHLAVGADACVSYGAEGTVATFLLAGVPQLISPWHVEAHMAARRIEALGAAVVLRNPQDSKGVLAGVDQVLAGSQLRERARALSMRHQNLRSPGVVESVVTIIEAAQTRLAQEGRSLSWA